MSFSASRAAGAPAGPRKGSDARARLPASPDFRSARSRFFHVYSDGFVSAHPARVIDKLCEDAVSGQERIVDLVMSGRATPGAMAEGRL